ncbi:MAG: tripartite tricarboxylate transporter substrate binding protein [Streptosporangiales bacterium]|nr:tripartite tricarboxylate transporter substrate binding protein [Streptosporangiales bacterium]
MSERTKQRAGVERTARGRRDRGRAATTMLVGAAVAVALGATSCGALNPTGGGGGGGGAAGAWKPRGDVRMIIPFGAGGGSDLAGRATAAGLEEASPGLNVNPENREGGAGAVGYGFFMSKQGDPQTLLATENALVTMPQTSKVPWTYKSFTPIAKIAEDGSVVVVKKDSPLKSCMDVVDAAKKRRVMLGLAGSVGGTDDVAFRMIEQKTGVKFARLPTESGSEVVSALLGDEAEVGALNPGEVLGQLRSGELRAICTSAGKRYAYPELKDIETAKEQGIDITYSQFRGILAPGGLSAAEKAYWIEIARKAVNSKAFKKYATRNYLQTDGVQLYGDDFTAELAKKETELGAVLKGVGS